MPGVPRFLPVSTGTKRYGEPRPDKLGRLVHVLPAVHTEAIGDGLILVADTHNCRARVGAREVVGAVRVRGHVKLRIYCHDCGEENIISVSAWRVATAKASGECQKCMRKNVQRGRYTSEQHG